MSKMPEKRKERCQKHGKSSAAQIEILEELIELLRPLVERISNVDFDPFLPYSTCLRFAICRAFEFFDNSLKLNTECAFFLVPALRPITEDLILYRFIDKYCSKDDRDSVMSLLMFIDVRTRIKNQQKFFHSFRPFQPVLACSNESEEELRKKKIELREIWRRNELPGFGEGGRGRYLPTVRKMAEKIDPGILHVVYDFVYRLTSGEVHAGIQTLLRLGWSTSSNPQESPIQAKFSSMNLNSYHISVCQIYSAFLLCLWVELFEFEFGASSEDLTQLSEIKTKLWSRFRWPEIVTFEEMNVPVPDPEIENWPNMLIHSIYSVIMEDGYLSGAAEVERLRNSSGTRAN